MSTYISEETGLVVTIRCRYTDRPANQMRCSDDKTAVALRGQWDGSDPDVDPVWVPVCADHDRRWDTDCDTDEVMPERHRLPRFELKGN